CVRAAVRNLPPAELLHHASEGPDRSRTDRRRYELRDLPQGGRAALRTCARIVRDLPVPLGLERPADGADLRVGSEQAADDRSDPLPALDLRAGIPPPERRGLPADDRAAGGLLQPSALLRPGVACGLGQELDGRPSATVTNITRRVSKGGVDTM